MGEKFKYFIHYGLVLINKILAGIFILLLLSIFASYNIPSQIGELLGRTLGLLYDPLTFCIFILMLVLYHKSTLRFLYTLLTSFLFSVLNVMHINAYRKEMKIIPLDGEDIVCNAFCIVFAVYSVYILISVIRHIVNLIRGKEKLSDLRKKVDDLKAKFTFVKEQIFKVCRKFAQKLNKLGLTNILLIIITICLILLVLKFYGFSK